MRTCCRSRSPFSARLLPGFATSVTAISLVAVPLVFAAGLAAPLAAAENRPASAPAYESADVPFVAAAIRQAMQDGDFPAARKAIDEAAKAKDSPHDYLAYLRAWSLHLEKQEDAAIAAFTQFEHDFPQSPWLARARFAKAQAMVAKTDFRGAEAIYEQGAKELLSAGRMAQSAAVYREFADAAYQPVNQGAKPDFAEASQLYTRALEIGLDPAERPEVEFRVARCAQRLGSAELAAGGYEKFLKAHPDDRRGNEVRYRLGETLLAAGKPLEARRAWQELLWRQFFLPRRRARGINNVQPSQVQPSVVQPGMKPVVAQSPHPNPLPKGEGTEEAEDFFAAAAFRMAETWNSPMPADDEQLARAVAALEAFLKQYPSHADAGQAYLNISRCLVHRRKFDEAVAALDRFLKDPHCTGSRQLPEAAMAMGKVFKEQKKHPKALAVWRDFLVQYPADPHWSDVQQLIIDTEYEVALARFKAGDDAAARRLFDEFMAHYPLDVRNPGIMFLFGQMPYRQQQWEAAIAAWEKLVTKYPKTEEASHAAFLIGRTLEERLGRFEDAQRRYRSVTGSDAADAARADITLSSKSMQLTTERIFRGTEVPRLHLTSRNLPDFKVRVYKIDLETYFRKMHTVAGVERLDVSLIDPDATFDFKVPDFARYKAAESEIPLEVPPGYRVPMVGGGSSGLPLVVPPSGGSSSGLPPKGGTTNRAGVAAVTVSCPDLEATSLVIQSDLDILLKCSRRDVAVFAVNGLTGRPWPGVRLLVSNGRAMIAEGTTGEDGTFTRTLPELKDAAFVSVFASAGQNVASAAVAVEGKLVSNEPDEVLLVETDRPVYTAGETVHVRGYARNISDKHYKIPVGEKCTVDVFNKANRRLRRQDVALSPMGTFDFHFPLPEFDAENTYQIIVTHGEAPNEVLNKTVFRVRPPQRDALRLTLELPKRTLLRGEAVVGRLRAVLPLDRPLVGAKIDYSLGRDFKATAVTDSSGEVRLSIPTADLETTGDLPFTAAIQGQKVEIRTDVTVTTEALAIELETNRALYLAGEPFEARVKTTGADGRPVAAQVMLEVFEKREEPAGEEGPTTAQQQIRLTTAGDGLARQTLKIAKGGRYKISASGIDRFGNHVVADKPVTISGEEDRRRLLMLVDRTDLKAGETADVQVIWRGGPALAIITCHTDRILQKRQVMLARGVNRLQIPVDATMAPVFALTASVMADGEEGSKPNRPRTATSRYHEASCEFAVDRALQVKIDCQRRTDGVRATITTRDPLGKPVPAEFCLAALPFPSEPLPNADIVTYLRDYGSVARFTSASSIQFEYQAQSRRTAGPQAGISTASPTENPPRGGGGRAPRNNSHPAEPQRGDDPFGANVRPSPVQSAAIAPTLRRHILAGVGMVEQPKADEKVEADFQTLQELIKQSAQPAGTGLDDDEEESGGEAERPNAPRRKKTSPDEPIVVTSTAPLGPRPQNGGLFGDVANAKAADSASNLARGVLGTQRPVWPGQWFAAVKTGSDGVATVMLSPPDEVSKLDLVAKAITADTRAGRVQQSLSLENPLAVRIDAPAALTDGDEIVLPVVVENRAVDSGFIDIDLKIRVGGESKPLHQRLPVKRRGRIDAAFRAVVKLPAAAASGTVVIEAQATTGGKSCISRREVPLIPARMIHTEQVAGIASGPATITIPGGSPAATSLQITLHRNPEESLMEMIVDKDSSDSRRIERFTFGDTAIANDLLAAVSLMKVYPLQTVGGPLLDDRIRTLIGLLLVDQRDVGSWIPDEGDNRVAATALAYWSLNEAKKAGFDVPPEPLAAAAEWLRANVVGNPAGDLESKAIFAHVRAAAGSGEFALVNQLLRDHASLSPLARPYLALALLEMDRKDAALDLLRHAPAAGDVPLEARAITALCWLAVDPASAESKATVESLLNSRQALRWSPEPGTGAAARAAAIWLARNRTPRVGSCRVEVLVNDKQLTVVDLSWVSGPQTVDVPLAMLTKDRQRITLRPITLQPSTGARIAYSCTMTATADGPAAKPAAAKPATTQDKIGWSLKRSFAPGNLEAYGQELEPGYSSLAGTRYEKVDNRMTQLPAGRCGRVVLRYQYKGPGEDSMTSPAKGDDAPEGPWVIVDSLPAGSAVVESTIQGEFAAYMVLPGRMVFLLGPRRLSGEIRYVVEGLLPGSYRAAPAVICRCGAAIARGATPADPLAILEQGAKSADPYRYSPDELVQLGQSAKEKGDNDAALKYFTELVETWHGKPRFGLCEDAYRKAVSAFVSIYLDRGPAAKAVQYCEIIKERWPEEPVTLEQLLKAAAAYREIGEFERSYGVCRAVIEGKFVNDSGMAGFLESRGEILRGVRHTNRLLQEYPPEPYAAEAEIELAQHVYALAGSKDARLSAAETVKQGLDHETLLRRAWEKLEAFLTAFPKDAGADQASFAAANTLLDRKQFAEAGRAAAAYARRFAKSDLLDSYWYVEAYCDFATGKHASAIDMCRKVAETRRRDKATGEMVESVNKNRAIYILGQIYQTLGQRGDAVREYRRIEGLIPEAKSTVDFFARQRIAIPECTTIRPGAAAEVELAFSNVPACDVKVYRVDLLKLCESGQALGDLGQVNLAGIRPLVETTVALGDGHDYRDRARKLALPLKQEGAYLIVCRGEELYASGLVLISPLEIESHFDPATKLVQVFVKDAASGKYVSDAQVRIAQYGGSQPPRMLTGATDLRGVFAGQSLAPSATIVVRSATGGYAFATAKTAQPEASSVAEQARPAATGEQPNDPTAPFRGHTSRSRSVRPVEVAVAEETPEEGSPRATGNAVTALPADVSHLGILAGSSDEAAEQRIRQALREPAMLEFVDTKFKDIISYLKETHHIEIQLDAAALKDGGFDEGTEITKSLKGIDLRSALKLLLDDLKLKYVIHNGVLVITTPEKAESEEYMQTRVYVVDDLVLPAGDPQIPSFEPLIELITRTVATKTWAENGGTGTMSPIQVGNHLALVFSQTEEVQEEVAATLEALRRAGGLAGPAGEASKIAQQRAARPAVRRNPTAQGMGGFGGGMGGGFGGMGGVGFGGMPQAMGGSMGGGMGPGGMGQRAAPGQGGFFGRAPQSPRQTPFVISVIPVVGPGGPDLLEGVRGLNQANQSQMLQSMKSREAAGQAGGGMGGMGGGMGGMF
jgi:alpha-2-macroglobulin